jgi:hypothetical protein
MPITASTSAAGGGLGGSGAFASLPLGSMLGGIPGGYFVLDLLRNVLRKFPGAQPGVGCGVGFGYGIGIGLHYGRAGAATFRRTSYSVPSSGAYRAGSEYVAPAQPAAPAPAPSPDVLRRVNELEKRLQNLEERLNTQIRLFELEQRLNRLERDTGATGKKKGHWGEQVLSVDTDTDTETCAARVDLHLVDSQHRIGCLICINWAREWQRSK